MLQHEFESRTQMSVSPAMYEQIEAIYNATSDEMDKDMFCADFKEGMLSSKIVAELVAQVENLRNYITHLQATMEKDHEKVANFVIAEAEEYSSSRARKFGIDILGKKEYLRRKISQGYDLWTEDREFLVEILGK